MNKQKKVDNILLCARMYAQHSMWAHPFLFVLFWMASIQAASPPLFDLEKEGVEQYQDLYIQGAIVKKASFGERFMQKRFDIINSVLARYKRPFTMLDVGAAQGYFCFKAADMYPKSVFVMLEGSNEFYPKISEQLSSIFVANQNYNNVIWLNTPIVVEDIERLSQSEHFDVILALNIFHWFPEHWQRLLEALHEMSHVLIIETPPIDEALPKEQHALRQTIHNHFAAVARETIQGVPRHTNPSLYTTYYILERTSPFRLKRTSMLHPDYGDRDHFVFYDYETKHFCKKDRIEPFIQYVTPWQPGINLLSFLMLRGAFPLRKEISRLLPENASHTDWMPNNMVLQGKNLVLIDKGDLKNQNKAIGANFYTKDLRKRVEKLLKCSEPKAVKKAFFALVNSVSD
jgi:hypothetical protein